MACGALDPIACLPLVPDPAVSIGGTILDTVLKGLSDAIGAGIKAMVADMAVWILAPSDPVCATPVPSGSGVVSGDWVTSCQHAPSAAATLNGYVLPITIFIAVLGLIWQGIVMAVTRRGEPLLQAVRGLWNCALWGAVGIAGTQLALHASDTFADWIIKTALSGSDPGPGNDTLTFTIAFETMLTGGLPTVSIIGVIVGLLIMMTIFIQTILMIFRDAAIAILAGMLQLAASGSFTKATSPWLPKVTGWMAALITYKPMAAMCYAAGLALMSDHSNPNNFLVGAAVLALTVIALPALMKFFNWTVGTVQSSSSLGTFGAGAAAGLHAASSLRGLGGNSATEHSQYMETNGPGGGAEGPSGSGAPSGPGPGGPRPGSGGGSTANPKVIDGEATVAETDHGAPVTPTTTVPAGTGATAPVEGGGSGGSGGSSSAPSGGSGGTAPASSPGGGAPSGATSGAAETGASASGGASGAAAATGPAAPVVLGVVVAAQAASDAAHKAANTATDSMDGDLS